MKSSSAINPVCSRRTSSSGTVQQRSNSEEEGQKEETQSSDPHVVAEADDEYLRSARKAVRLINEGFGPQLFSFNLREADDNGNVPLRFQNRTHVGVFALGIIVGPEEQDQTKLRMISFLPGQSKHILAKASEDFIFVGHGIRNYSSQPVGFCTANGSTIEYFLRAGTASEINIGDKITGMRSLKEICADTILAQTGNSPDALNQLPLSKSLKEHLIDKTHNSSFDRAKKLLDDLYDWMKLMDQL